MSGVSLGLWIGLTFRWFVFDVFVLDILVLGFDPLGSVRMDGCCRALCGRDLVGHRSVFELVGGMRN